MHDVRELPSEVKDELERFFTATDELEDKTLKFIGWRGPKEAERLICKCEKKFRKKIA